MKANEFVKKFGLDWAIRYIDNIPFPYKDYENSTSLAVNSRGGFVLTHRDEMRGSETYIHELKSLVDSLELIESLGGIHEAKHELLNRHIGFSVYTEIKKAIADFEACQ